MTTGYIIIRKDGKFLMPSGSDQVWSDRLQGAVVFKTREAALKDLCPLNERVVQLADYFHSAQTGGQS